MSILRASPRATAMGTDGPTQTVVRRVVAVTWVCSDVVRADDAFTLEGRSKHGSVSRHRKALELLARHAGQRVQHVALARAVQDVVEKGAELA